MRILAVLAGAMLLLVLADVPGHADKRVALVIGNAAYRYMPQLINPKNDAEDVGAALRDLGFEAIVATDLDRTMMNDALGRFSRIADGADIGLVFYAGHGMQLNGTNYLLPTEAHLESVADVNRFQLMPVDDVLETLRSVRGARILMLDACRNNPVEEDLKRRLAAAPGANRGAALTRGFTRPSAGNGLLVAYATQANDVANDGTGRNSPFTAAFLKHVGTADLDLRQMMFNVQDEVDRATGGKQRPELSISLVGQFKLKIASVTPQRPDGGLMADAAERAWASVKDTTSIAILEEFRRQYANSVYATFAGARIEEIRKHQTAVVSPPVPPAAPQLPAIAAPAVVAPPFVAPTPSGPCGGAIMVSLAARCAAPLSAAEERGLKPPDRFKECENCPEMVTVAAGAFVMGSPATERAREAGEGPQQQVLFENRFAVGRTEVSFEEWDACAAEGGCNAFRPGDYGWGRGKRPVINVSWNDAQAYVKWLSEKTGAPYRLLSESEREYVTRGCTSAACPSTPFWFGAEISPDRANYDWRFSYAGSPKAQPARRTVATDASEPNLFGLLHVHGNVREWVEDCWNANLSGLPRNGAARNTGDCTSHVVRGGSWADEPKDLRSAKRSWELATERRAEIGFRVARSLQH
jgi:formylglycine-generating enzyme required for sulfatase activity